MGKFNADILGRLAELSVTEINTALAAIRADGEALNAQPSTDANVAALNDLVGYARQLSDRKAALGQLAASQTAALSDLDSLTAPESAPEPAPAPDPAPADPAPEPAPAADPAPNADPAPEADPAPTPDDNKPGDSVTAAGRRPLGGVNQPPAGPAPALGQVTLRTTAAANAGSFTAGAVLTREQVAQTFSDKARATHGKNVRGFERYSVVTVRSEFPEERRLSKRAGAFGNIETVERVVDQARSVHARDNLTTRVAHRRGVDGVNALTAAGLCAPLETLYDIRTIGDTDRPIRDALVRFGADRGGIQYRPALDGVTQTGGIGVWTPTDDEDMDPEDPESPRKVCVEIECPGILTAEVDAIYQCLTFSNMSTQFDPEWMDSTIRAQAIAHARFSENRLYTQLIAGSKNLFSTRTLGATRDILFTLDKITAYYRNVHRLAQETPLRWITPAWTRNLMRADITRQMVGDGLQSLAVTDAMLDSWLAERNINATYHLDGIDPAELTVPEPDVPVPAQFYTLALTNTAVPEFPTAISSALFAEGDWLHLDGGTLDMGVVRDSALNGQNRFQTFSESFETTAFRGIESVHLVLPVLPTGESAATADTTP
jgi:cell pole-organizing protein PopZ